MQVNEARAHKDNSDWDNVVFDAIKSIDGDTLVDEIDDFLKLLGSQYKRCSDDSPQGGIKLC